MTENTARLAHAWYEDDYLHNLLINKVGELQPVSVRTLADSLGVTKTGGIERCIPLFRRLGSIEVDLDGRLSLC